MAVDDIDLLLVRPDDMLVAAIRFRGFDVQGTQLAARAGGSFVDLTLPPQSTGETPFNTGTGLPADARPSGRSVVRFKVDAPTTFPLTATGVLGALATARLVLDPTSTGGTFVDVPWRMLLAPTARVPGDSLLASFASDPLRGPLGAAGLWHLRLEAASGVGLVPVGVEPDGDLVPPLDVGWRNRIFAEGIPPAAAPSAPYVDLSPLGGTLSVTGTWPNFSWQHQVVLGRDMSFRVEATGFLYPFGHRAVLTLTGYRKLTPDQGPAVAGIQIESSLVVSQPVRQRPTEGRLARAFPFDEVEVLERRFLLSGDDVPERFDRPAKALDDLIALEESLRQQLADQEAAMPALFQARRDELDAAFANAGAPSQARLAVVEPRIFELEEIDRIFQEWSLANPPPGPDTDPPVFIFESDGMITAETGGSVREAADGGPPMLTPAEGNELRALRGEHANLVAFLDQVERDRVAAQNALVDETTLAAAGGVYAEGVALVQRLRTQSPETTQLLAARRAEIGLNQQLAYFSWPQHAGQPLQLPMRCDGVRMNVPALFVRDMKFDDGPTFHAFDPLHDAAIQARLDAAWNGNVKRDVPLPGTEIDLVRSGPAPKPGDVVTVRQLSIGGGRDAEGLFRPVIERAKVLLPAVAELVPDLDGLADIEFDTTFLEEGVADLVALRLTNPLKVDFRKAADRAGGLVSPTFAADVISRELGPIAGEALPGLLSAVPDLAAAFEDATILGFPLASVVDAAALPEPMAIVTEPGGGVKMTWKVVKLKSTGPLRVDDPGPTTLTMTVKRSPAATVTTCRLENFALVLPPGAGDLVRLDFAALTFTQRPGSAPDLAIDDLRVSLGGDLGLLKTLQDNVDLGDALPAVRTTPTGMSIGYALELPDVTAGMFVMRNIAVRIGVDVPFDGNPIVTTLAFASPQDPFSLSVSIFGGSGYLVFEIGPGGIRRLEASLDFGATVAIGVGVATAEVHALGGVRFQMAGDRVRVSGFLRVGGSVDVLGLVSVSLELRVELSYDGSALTGRATAVIEVDVTFWSGSVELDSGTYTFAGAEAVEAPTESAELTTAQPTLADWQRYRKAFGS